MHFGKEEEDGVTLLHWDRKKDQETFSKSVSLSLPQRKLAERVVLKSGWRCVIYSGRARLEASLGLDGRVKRVICSAPADLCTVVVCSSTM